MRISDWSSDVCSSDLCRLTRYHRLRLRCQHGLLLKLLQFQGRRLLRPRHTRRIARLFELVGNVRDILCEDRLADENNLTARTSALELIVKRRQEFAHSRLVLSPEKRRGREETDRR